MTARTYANEAIEVSFDAAVCIHAARCLRGLPAVFQRDRRPWILLDGADAAEVAEVVRSCPSGALHYHLLDGTEDEAADEPATVQALRDGPLALRGQIDVLDADGALLRHDTRVVLCRCGHSENKPFCDGTHRRIGFTAG